MSKRGVFWGLGGLLGVVLATTLCILLVTVMGTGAQNSSQSSVEPQVTNLPTGETSDYEIAESPEVEQRAPSDQPPFQPNDRSSVALGPLPSESPPEASFAASSSPVARGADDMITAMITVSGAAMNSTKVEGETATVKIELSSPLPTGLTLADDDLKLVATNDKRWPDLSGLDENGSVNLVNLFGDGTTAEVPLFVVDDMILERDERVRLILEASSNLQPHFNLMDPGKNLIVVGDFDIIDNEDGTITIVAEDSSNGAEITTVQEAGAIYPRVKLPPGVIAEADIRVFYHTTFVESMDENGNVRTPLSPAEISGNTDHNLTIQANENRSDQGTIILNGDAIPEETEWFQLVLVSVQDRADSTKQIAATVDRTPLNITVLDNEPLEYEIEGADAIDEGAGSYTVQLRRKGRIYGDLRNVPGPVTVPYTISGGDSSPASEADFPGNAFPSGSFTFSGYDALSDEVSIMIEDDGASEDTETFKISVTGGTSTPKEVAIIDNDDEEPATSLPTISLEVPDVVFENLSAVHDLTATLSGPVMEEVTVTLVVGPDSTAELIADYQLLDHPDVPDVIEPGQVTAGFRLYAPTDMSHDGDKHLVLTPIATIGTTEVMGVSRTITIRDIDPPPTLSITTDSFETTEPAIVSNFFIGVELDTPLTEDLTVFIRVVSSGTAEEGEDFRLLDAVTIDAGSTVGDDSPGLQILPDSIYEGEEYIVLELTTNDPNVRTPPRITITIKDDDPLPTASLDLIAPTIMEDQDREITARLDAVAGVTVTVSLLRGAESSAVEADYELSPLSVPIAPGELTATFQLSAIDDPLYELGETLILQPITRDGAKVLTGTAQTVTILEDDLPVVIGFDSGTYRVNEASGTVELTVSVISGVLMETITLSYAASDVSTMGSDDYTVPENMLELSLMNTSVTISVDITDDMSDEPEEEFRVVLSGAPAGIILDPATATVTITDNDEVPLPEVTLRLSRETVVEGSTETLYIELSEAPSEDVTVTLTVGGTAATDGTDYSLLRLDPYVLKPGDTELAVGISTVVDGLYEGAETIEFVISTLSGSAVTGAMDRVTVTLTDDTLPTISLEVPVEVSEGDLAYDLTATLSGPVAFPVTVLLYIEPESTAKSVEDYVLSIYGVIEPGQVIANFTFLAVSDVFPEGDELLVLTPGVPIDGGEVIGMSRTITIRNVDPPVRSISFVATESTIAEDATNLQHDIELQLSGVLEDEIEVTFTVAGSATRSGMNADYILTATTVTIPANTPDAIIQLDVNNDDLYDGRPHETVVLSLVSATGGVTVDATKDDHTVTITDDEDAPTVTLGPATPSVTEGERAVFTVTLSHGVDEAVTLELAVSNGSSENDDYDRTHSETQLSVTIGAGETTGELSLKTNRGNVYEGDETVMLSLSATSGGENVMGLPISRELTITEFSAPPTLSLSGPSMVSENDASVSFKATLSGDLLEANLEVELAVVRGTAEAGDYTLSPAQATIPGMQREVEFTLETNDNEILHGDKTVELELRRVSGPVVTLGIVALTLTIEEDEQPVVVVPEVEVVTATVSLSATSWYEGADNALVVTFELADGVTVANDVTIDYELEFPTIDTDGNRRMAADAADFVGATTGTVLIPAGEPNAKIEIASRPSDGYRYLGFNARDGRGPFVNVAFRQAVATLIDTEQIAREVLQGVVSPIYSVVPEGNGFWHNPDLPRFGSGLDGEARINEAVRILADGGYTWTKVPSWDAINGRVIAGEGFADSAGQEVRKFEIVYVHGEQSFDPFRFAAANLIEEWLNEVGIPTEVTTSSIDTTFVSTIVSEVKRFDAWILGWNPTPYPRSHLVNTFTTGAFYNLGSWSNTEYDRLAADFPRNEPTDAMELARVRELAFQMQAILAHEMPYVVLFPTPPVTENLALADDSVSEEPELVGIRLTGARVVSGATLMVADEPAIITILDNDAVEYVIEGAETVAEEDGVYVARLRRRGYTLSDASVDYTIIGLGPNAADHNDFVNGAQLPTGAVTFVGHDAVTFVGHDTLSSEIRIPLMDDAVSEGREAFQIVVARGVSILPATRDVTLWDADASRPVISLDPITDITEGENLTITARLSSIAMNDVMLSLTVSSTLLSDAYPDSADYTLSSPQTIQAGDLTTTFILETVDDTIYEGIEFGKLVLTIITPGADVDAGNVERTFRLIDNDPVTVVSLDPVDARITEVENLTVTVRLSNPTNVDVTLALAVFGDVDRGDYELATPTVTIPSGQLVATFNLNTVDYVLPEEDEQVELSLILISPEIGIGLGEVNRTFTLVDNDQVPIVSLDPVGARLDEGQSLMVTARLSRVVDFNTTLSLSVAGDVDQDDYTLSMPTVTIPPGQLVAIFTLDTTLDTDAEADELVELSLGIVSPAAGVGIGVGGAVRTFTLVDSGPAPIASLDPVSERVKEGEALTITVSLNIPAKIDTTLALVVSGAVDQNDYTLLTPTVTIPPGASVATFILNAVPDTAYEVDEQVELSLIVSPAGSARVGVGTRTFILEENGPVPTVSLDSVRPEITEGDNVALVITFKLPDGVTAANDITVDYELEFPTSDAAGNRRMAADATDFVGATTGTVLIEAGKPSADLEIANGPPGGYRYLGFNTQREQFNDVAFRQAVATLIDTDFIAQSVLGGVVSPIYSVVSESNGFWHNPNVPSFGSGLDREARINEAVRILKEGGYTWTKEPSWDETNSRVIAGEGFGDSAGSFTTTFEIVSVTESDDPFRFEAAKQIEEWLDDAGIPTTVTTADLFAISDMIPNFDAWILGWDIETLYPEGPLRVTFADGERSNYGSWVNAEYERLIAQLPTDEPTDEMDLARARELVFQLQAILARELPYVLLFPNPPATEDLALVDDKVSEEPELVGIRLTGARVVSGPTLMVDDDPAIITILDNDAVEYVIEGAEMVVEGGVYSAQLRRRGYTLSSATVAYTVVGLGPDAAAAADFSGEQLPSGEFTFVGHDALSAEIRIPLREDTVAEDPETFRIEVARGVSTLPATRDVTIIDNDVPTVTLSVKEFNSDVTEEAIKTTDRFTQNDAIPLTVEGLVGTLEMKIGLAARAAKVNDGGTAADVTFYQRSGFIETATFTLVANRTQDLWVATVNDDVVELEETVNLYIATVNGVRVIDEGVDIKIRQNDDTAATLTVKGGAEGGTTMATIDLGGKTLSSAIPSNALRLVLADGSTMNADVEIVATDIVAGLKETSMVNVPIILKDDGLVEGTETVVLELRIDSTIAPGLESLLTLPVGTSSFMLADADKDQVRIAALSRTSYNEGEDVMVTVGLPSGFTATAAITVDYKLIVTTTDEVGKASATDIDGSITTGSVTINEGAGTATITINLADNDGAEVTEQLGIRLTSASGTPGVTVDTTTTQLTILDTDLTEYTLEGAATVVEGGTYMVRLRRVGGLITPDATVSYTVSDAATGNDVDAADFGGTFPTGSFTFSGDDALSDEISIATGDDQTLESDETFQISAGGATKDVTITDANMDQVRIAALSRTSYNEGEDVLVTVELASRISAGVNITVGYELIVTTTDEVGKASAADITGLTSGFVTINDGARTAIITINLEDDRIIEETEQLGVRLTSASGAPGVTFDATTTQLMILDNEPIIGFRPEVHAVDESDGEVVLTVEVISGILTEEVTLTYTTEDGSATSPGDYTGANVVSIPALSAMTQSVTFRVTIVDDMAAESTEQFFVDLAGTLPAGVTLAPSRATVTITDTDIDPVVIGFDPASYRVAENAGSVALTVKLLSGSLTETVTLLYKTSDGAAIAVEDYDLTTGAITLSSGDSEETIRVPIIDDSTDETDEMFMVELSVVGSSGVILDPSVATVTILGNDQPTTPVLPSVVTATLSLPTLSVPENETKTFEIRLTGNAPENLTFTLVGDSAHAGDYTLSPDPIVISKGSDSVIVTVTAVDDTDAEFDEVFMLSLMSESSLVVIGDPGSITVTILANDQPIIPPDPEPDPVEIGFSSATYTVDEGAGSVMLTVEVISGTLTEDVMLFYVTADGSAVVNSDYMNTSDLLTLSPGDTEETIMVPIVNDDLFENDETFMVLLSLAGIFDGVTLDPAIATVTILANDQPTTPVLPSVVTATLSLENLMVPEDEARTFEIRLTGNAPEALTFTLVGGPVGEYSLSPDPIVISRGSDSVIVTVRALDDTDAESDEVFTLSLMSESSLVVIGDPGSITVTIPENDQPTTPVLPSVVTATLSLENLMVPEDEARTFEIRLTGNAPEALTFTLVGGPVGGYSLSPDPIVISRGSDSVIVTVTAVDDTDAEFDEVFTLSLMSESSLVVIGDPGSITVTIPENDQPPEATHVEFVVTSATIDEGDEYEIELRLVDSAGDPLIHSQDVMVTLGVSPPPGATNLLPSEYMLSSLVVNIPANEITGTILFKSEENNVDEPDKYITLRIEDVTFLTWHQDRMLRINVRDDDVPPDAVVIGFDPVPYSVDENDGSVVLTVKLLNGTLTETVVVNYEAMGGSAIAGKDYMRKSGMLTWSPGTTEMTITVSIIDDITHEPDQMFTVELIGTPADITLDPAIATVTITDDDSMPTVTITPASPSVVEGETATFTVTLTGEAEEDIEVTLTPTGDTAETSDYSVGAVSVTFSTGDTSKMLRLGTTEDQIYEDAETVSLGFSISGPATIASAPSTLTITNDDSMPTVTITPASPSVVEGETATFTVTLTGEAEEDIEVTLTPTGDTAETSDYSVGAVSVTFSTGDTSKMLRLGTTEDQIYEDAETVSLGFSISGPATIASAPSTLTITNDDSMPTVTITPASPSVVEGETATFTVTLTGEAEEDIEVTLTPTGDTAETSDYSVGAVSVTFSTGDTSKMLRLGTTEDQIYEDAETVSLGFSISGPATIASAPSTLTITNDDSMPTVTITPASPSVVEGETATFTVTLTGEAEEDIEVTLTPTGDTAETSDYSVGAVSVTFSTGDTSKMLRLGTTEDQIYEDAETVSLGFSISGPATIASAPSTLTITNDDSMPTVTITPASPSVVEGETATFTVTLTGEAEEDIEVTLTPTGDTAETSDYSVGAVSVTFSTGDTSKMLRLGTTEDQIYEDAETVSLGFSISGPATIASAPSTLTITNDDSMPTVTITPASPSVVEGEDAVFTVTLTGEAEEDIEVTLTPTGDTAETSDYSVGAVSVTFSTGDTSKMLRLGTTEDQIYEDAETVSLGFSISGPATIASAPSTLTITNDDSMPTVTITPASPSVVEGETATFTVTLTGEAEEDIEVTLTPTGDTAETSDYSVGAVSVTFSTGDTSKMLRLGTTEDQVYEGNEEVALSFSISGPAIEGSVPSILTIEDDDTVMIDFDPVMYTVDEDSGTVELTVKVLNGNLGRDVTLSYETINGSAVAGEDYALTTGTVTLSLMTPSVTFTVPIIDDDLSENAELFTVVLSGAPAGVTVDPASAEVTITDDEPAPVAEIGFKQFTYQVSEEVSRTVLTVSVISGVLPETVTLTYATVDGSATSGADYELSTGTLTLSPRMRTATIEVSVLDDSVVESAEMFFVDLGRASVTNMVLLAPFRASVTIEDNDIAIGFDSRTYRVGEASGTVELTVSVISGVLTETITLNYKTMDGSAISGGEDYTSTMSTVTLSPMTPSVTFTVPIIDDSTDEPEEEFTVVLSGAPADITLDPATATVTIIDNDPTPTATLSTADLKVEEGQDASFMIRLSGMSAEDLEFELTRIEGTAIEGDDYSLPTEPIVVPAGELGVSVTISTRSDVAYESTTVRFALTPVSGSNVNLGTPSEILLEIEELFDAVLTFQTDSVEVRDEDLDISVITEAGTYSETLRVVLRDVSAMREVLQELPAEYQHLEVSALADIYFVDDKGNTISDLDRGVTVTISVPMSEVDSPERISFAVLHDGASEWGVLATTYKVVDSEYVFETASDRFSLFGLVVLRPVVMPPVVVPPPGGGGGGPAPGGGGGGGGPAPGGGGGGGDPEPEPEPTPVTVSLEPAEQTVNEGDQIVVTVTLSEASDEDITVTLTASGTANTDDYGLTMQEMTIEAGDETAMFTISTTDDDIYEGDETLILSLSLNSSSSAEVEQGVSEITISDNDPVPTLSLEPNPSVREGDSVTIRARLSNASAEAISVALILEDGTAMLGSDYPPPVEFVTEIAPGAEFAEFIISTIDDSVYEPDETVLLQLVVVEGNVIEGTLAGTLSIIDDDPMPALSIDAPDEIIEGTTELVTIRLNVVNVDPVTVRVSAGSGGDVSEDDYTLSSAEVTIEPGQLEATVMLSVIDDGQTEINEILVLEVAADGFETVRHQITIPAPEPVEPPDPPVEPPVTPIEPPVEPVDPPPSSGLPITLLLGIGIGLAVLVVVVIIVVLVIRRRKKS